jgi:hypothetical protein
MVILAIDPGTEQSAVVLWDGSNVLEHQILANKDVEQFINTRGFHVCACELLASYGMPVGKETFCTAYWIGEFRHVCKTICARWLEVYRTEVKLHLCQSVRAKDGNVRQAIIDRLGPIGTVKSKGVLYGVHTHEWSALSVAIFAMDKVTPVSK